MKSEKFDNTLGSCLKNFWIDYTGWGRATRSEYWWCVLIYAGIIGVLISFSQFLVTAWTMVTIVPFVCLTARRLHDINRSAWNILWFPEGIVGICSVFWIVAFFMSALGVSIKAFMYLYLGLFTPIFWVSVIGSVILMCLPSDKKVNKYGKPRI